MRHLAREEGIRQFLDIGTGIPTADNTHEVAQAIAPESRVVYVDNDPIVLAHARALLTSSPEGATAYIDADLRDPERILRHPDLLRTIDLSRPVALMLVAILHFVGDDDDPYAVVTRLLDALPPGSYLAASHATHDYLPARGAGGEGGGPGRQPARPDQSAYPGRVHPVLRRAGAVGARRHVGRRVACRGRAAAPPGGGRGQHVRRGGPQGLTAHLRARRPGPPRSGPALLLRGVTLDVALRCRAESHSTSPRARRHRGRAAWWAASVFLSRAVPSRIAACGVDEGGPLRLVSVSIQSESMQRGAR